MDSATLRGRRGIEWSHAVPARARGWRLVVDKPSLLGTAEGMASIVADPAAEVWGVLYDISAEDYEHLELTEGVRIDHYRTTEILVEPLADAAVHANGHDPLIGEGAPVVAVTVTSDERDSALRPTTRYMGILVSGAEEHGLPSSWIALLRAIEAVEETAEHADLRPYFDRAMKKPA
jgi:hypothetical protein